MHEDKTLASRFENFGAEPSAELWSKIESGLVQNTAKKRFFWIFGLSSLTALIASALIWNSNAQMEVGKTTSVSKWSNHQIGGNTNEGSVANNSIAATASITKQTKPTNETFFKSNTAGIAAHHKYNGRVKTKPTKNKSQLLNGENEIALPSEINLQTKESAIENNTKTVEMANIIDSTKAKTKELEPLAKSPDIVIIPEEKKKPKFEVSFSLGAARGLKTPILFYQPPGSTPPATYTPLSQTGSDYSIAYNPLMFQLLIGMDIKRRFRAYSGLSVVSYSYADFSYGTNEKGLSGPRTLLEIPVLFDYKIINRPKWEWLIGTGVNAVYSPKSVDEGASLAFTFQGHSALRYSVKENWQIAFQPTFRYQGSGYSGFGLPFYKKGMLGANLGLVWKIQPDKWPMQTNRNTKRDLSTSTDHSQTKENKAEIDLLNSRSKKDSVVHLSEVNTPLEISQPTETSPLLPSSKKKRNLELKLTYGAGTASKKPIKSKEKPAPNSTPIGYYNHFELDLDRPYNPYHVQLTLGMDLGKYFRVYTGLSTIGLSNAEYKLTTPGTWITGSINFLELPLLIDYKILETKKWEWLIGTGMNTSFNYKYYGNASYFTINFQAHTALRYSIHEKWQIAFQPTFRYQGVGIGAYNSPFHQRSIWGANLGVVWKFQKN